MKRQPPKLPHAAPSVDASRGWLAGALLALLAARVFLSETYQNVALDFLAGGVDGPTPATTVALDALLLVGAAILLAFGKRPTDWIARTAIGGCAALFVAALISTNAAADQRVAANASAQLVILALTAIALRQVAAQQPQLQRIAAAVLLAGLAANATKCLTQRAYEFRETAEHWRAQAPQRAARGIDPDDPIIVNYERRLLSNAAFGYQSHANIVGSCMALGLPLAAALAWRGLAQRAGGPALIGAALTALLGAGLWATDSAGAAIAAAAGLAAWATFCALRGAWRRSAIWGGLAVAALLPLALIATRTAGGTLPDESLEFRWEYWSAGWHAWREDPLNGCGRENFLYGFLRHKSDSSTEEVRNPHSLWAGLLFELGPLGVLGGTALLLAAWGGLARAVREPPASTEPRALPGLAIGVGVLALLVQGLASRLPALGEGMALVWTTETAGAWLLAFVAALAALGAVESSAGSACRATAVCGGLLATLLHGAIDFAYFTSAGASSAVLLLAAAPAAPAADSARRGRIFVGAGLALLVILHLWQVVAPTWRGERAMAAIASNSDPNRVDAHASVDPRSDAIPRRLAEYWRQRTAQAAPERRSALLARATEMAELALRRNSASASNWSRLADLDDSLAELLTDSSDPKSADTLRILRASAAQRRAAAAARHPTDPRLHLAHAAAEVVAWRATGEAKHAESARAAISRARQIDSARKADVAVRLREREIEAARELQRELGG